MSFNIRTGLKQNRGNNHEPYIAGIPEYFDLIDTGLQSKLINVDRMRGKTTAIKEIMVHNFAMEYINKHRALVVVRNNDSLEYFRIEFNKCLTSELLLLKSGPKQAKDVSFNWKENVFKLGNQEMHVVTSGNGDVTGMHDVKYDLLLVDDYEDTQFLIMPRLAPDANIIMFGDHAPKPELNNFNLHYVYSPDGSITNENE